MLTVMICSSLTTFMYNGRVSDKWKRAHLQMRQQNMYVDQGIHTFTTTTPTMVIVHQFSTTALTYQQLTSNNLQHFTTANNSITVVYTNSLATHFFLIVREIISNIRSRANSAASGSASGDESIASPTRERAFSDPDPASVDLMRVKTPHNKHLRRQIDRQISN